MRKIIVTVVLCVTTVFCFAQEELGRYPCKYFDKECKVSYSDKINAYIIEMSSGESHDAMYFIVQNNTIEKFRGALAEAKAKYIEWTQVAKSNNVKDFDKHMDVYFPSGDISWVGSDSWFDFRVSPNPRFLVKDNEYYFLLFSGQKVTASDNEYITEKAYWVFSSPNEVTTLENLISKDALNKIKEIKAKTDELFR